MDGAPNIYVVGDDNNKDIQVVNVRRLRKYTKMPPHLLPQEPHPDTSTREDEISESPGSSAKNFNKDQNIINQHQRWHVDCLMGKKKVKGTIYYLVRWANSVDPITNELQSFDPTWEPEENIDPELVDDYERLTSGFRRR